MDIIPKTFAIKHITESELFVLKELLRLGLFYADNTLHRVDKDSIGDKVFAGVNLSFLNGLLGIDIEIV